MSPLQPVGPASLGEQVDTHSSLERVSTCAGYSFGRECVAGRYSFGIRTCIDLGAIQLRARMCGERIHIRRTNAWQRPAPRTPVAYRSSTRAVDFAYAVERASKKSVFTMLALLYCETQAMSAGSSANSG